MLRGGNPRNLEGPSLGWGRMDRAEEVDEVRAGNEAAVTPALILSVRDSRICPD